MANLLLISDWNDQHVVKISSTLTLRRKSYVIFKEIVLIGRGSLAWRARNDWNVAKCCSSWSR